MTETPHQSNLRSALRPDGPPRLELYCRRRPGVTVVEAEGEVDVLTAPKLRADLGAAIRTGTEDLLVDLRPTTFLDSSGLHALLGALRRLTRQSRGFAVICRPGPVRRVIELARLVETLGVVEDPSEYRRDGRAPTGSRSPQAGARRSARRARL